MNTKIILCFLLSAFPAFAGPAADLAAKLSVEDKALLNAALIEQRTALVAAHEAGILAAAADFKAKLATADAAKTAAESKAARVPALLKQKLAAERATGEGPKTRLLEALILEAEKPEKAARRQALIDEIAAKQKEAASLE